VFLDSIFIALNHKFGNYFEAPPFILKGKLRCIFQDRAVLDIYYPDNQNYSFQFIRSNNIERFDTAKHHVSVETFPNHHHQGSENNIIRDDITTYQGNPVSNAIAVVMYIIKKYYN
jgi:hypothetical protein